MGDYPIKHARHPMELTDQIFGPATQHEALQDEIYCQIMRQMTGNNNRWSSSVHLQLCLKVICKADVQRIMAEFYCDVMSVTHTGRDNNADHASNVVNSGQS